MQNVHISQIKVGDTVLHDGVIRTVCKNNINHCSFMGKSIFGDSYKLGRDKVVLLQPSEIRKVQEELNTKNQ